MKESRERVPSYTSLQKVIRFDRGEPEIAYTIAHVFYGHLIWCETHWRIRITCYEKEAKEGKGIDIRIDKVQPYSDALWSACERWLEDRSKLDVTLDSLRKGKVAFAYQTSLL